MSYKKKETYHNRLDQEKAKLKKEAKALAKQEFSCTTDAEQARCSLVEKTSTFVVSHRKFRRITQPTRTKGSSRKTKEE